MREGRGRAAVFCTGSAFLYTVDVFKFHSVSFSQSITNTFKRTWLFMCVGVNFSCEEEVGQGEAALHWVDLLCL